MTSQTDLETIKSATAEFLTKMTIPFVRVDVVIDPKEEVVEETSYLERYKEVVTISIFLNDPKILIGQGGQTLVELQRILRIILNKKLAQFFYVNLDINDYKVKKIEYLRTLAKEAAEEVIATKQKKEFLPMPSYERRILHKELSKIETVLSQSEGEGEERHITVIPK